MFADHRSAIAALYINDERDCDNSTTSTNGIWHAPHESWHSRTSSSTGPARGRPGRQFGVDRESDAADANTKKCAFANCCHPVKSILDMSHDGGHYRPYSRLLERCSRERSSSRSRLLLRLSAGALPGQPPSQSAAPWIWCLRAGSRNRPCIDSSLYADARSEPGRAIPRRPDSGHGDGVRPRAALWPRYLAPWPRSTGRWLCRLRPPRRTGRLRHRPAVESGSINNDDGPQRT